MLHLKFNPENMVGLTSVKSSNGVFIFDDIYITEIPGDTNYMVVSSVTLDLDDLEVSIHAPVRARQKQVYQ